MIPGITPFLRPFPVFSAHGGKIRRLYEQSRKIPAESIRHPGCRTYDLRIGGRGGQTYENMFLRRTAALPVGYVLRYFIHSVGTAAQSQLPQSDQCGKIRQAFLRTSAFLSAVRIRLLSAFDQLLRLDIHQLHLIRSVKNAVGNPFSDSDTGNRIHNVIETLDVLHIDSGIDIDAAVQQLLHILIALQMTGACGIFMSQFIDDQQLRFSFNGPVQVEFPRHSVFRHPFLWRQCLQLLQQIADLPASVGFHISHRNVDTPALCGAGCF